ncbi:MAG TPA: SRPBCC family protein [Gemmatimonadales bacterium]|nr:SRPBCC family protein [Gemmatimonadales bacterium]
MATATKTGVTSYATPNEREVVVTRVVDAPRRLVFAAWTDPRHIPNWLLGPEGWMMPVCELDLRPGGAWRYVWRKADGSEMTMGGLVREVTPPERLVTTERWGPEWPETINTLTLTESGGRTTITLTITYPSKAARDAALETGMKGGMDESFARLDRLVQSLA